MNVNFGFIILSPEHNIGGLKNTMRSIEGNYKKTECVCVVPKEIKKEQIKEIKELCDVYKGGLTLTSLINKGFEKTKCDWNILILEGSRVPKNFYKKYEIFIQKQEDILYPLIVEHDIYGYVKHIYDKFYDCTINGICINKNFFNKVGKLSENPLEISRKFWALEAKEKMANFKTILGIKIC
jgi:hypothetical protein